MESAVEAQQGVETAVNETETQQITPAQIATLAQVTTDNPKWLKTNVEWRKAVDWSSASRQHGKPPVVSGDRSRLRHGSHSNASAAPQRADGAGSRRHPGRTAVCYSVATGPGRAGGGTHTWL